MLFSLEMLTLLEYASQVLQIFRSYIHAFSVS